MKKYLFLLMMIFVACSSFAQTPEELLNYFVPNIGIPFEKIENFHFQLCVKTETDIYPAQVWYKNDGNFGFNLFDKDKTPLLMVRKDKALFYEAVSKQVLLFSDNITVLKIFYENADFNATINCHKPNDEEKENIIRVDFLELAKSANANMSAAEVNGDLVIVGYTNQNSQVTTVVGPNDYFPLKSLKIDGAGFSILFNDIKVNVPMTGNEEFFTYPEASLKKCGLKVTEQNVDDFLGAMQMMQHVMHSFFVRNAIYDEASREDIEKSLNLKVDWADLKASDMLNSAKLRRVFEQKLEGME